MLFRSDGNVKRILARLIVLLSGLAGCFGSDELFDEKPGIPGGLALACLQDDKFEKMKIHFLYANGYDPIAMDLVKTRLQQVCDKPGGIQIVANEIDFSEDTSWSSDDVRDARWKHGGDAMGSDTLHWYFLFPKGSRSEERRVGKECRSRWSPYH